MVVLVMVLVRRKESMWDGERRKEKEKGKEGEEEGEHDDERWRWLMVVGGYSECDQKFNDPLRFFDCEPIFHFVIVSDILVFDVFSTQSV